MSASTEPEKDAAAAAAAPEGEAEAEGIGSGCELLYCGGTKFDTMDQKGGQQGRNLESPTRLRPLVGVDIRFVATGCTACHCVALDANGQCYTWGRNEMGQLGHGDTLLHDLPTVVSGLSNYKTIKASVGKNHTVVVTDDGMSFSFGHNKYGQLGIPSISKEFEPSPVQCDVDGATNVACGADFTIWLSSKEGYSILSAGRSQFGQLGQGNNRSNAKDSLAKLTNEPSPRSIHSSFKNTVVKVACGTNHTVAVDSKGFVYTWGRGTYGRLGHGKQSDVWEPCPLSFFENSKVLPPNAVVSAGSASSACTAGGGLLYLWGNVTDKGDYWLRPKHVEDLSGWNIGCMAAGNLHHIVATDDTCISWGIGPNGELGHGPNVLKSSEKPKKIDSLQGMHVRSVGCGYGLTLIVVDKARLGHRLDQLEVYDGNNSSEEAKDPDESHAKRKQTKDPDESRAKRKQTKDPDESEEDESGDDEETEKMMGRRGRKPSNRGRGRGRGRAGAALATPEQKPSRRGRGRAKKTESLAPRGRSRK